MNERITLDKDMASDLRTVAAAAKLADTYQISRRGGALSQAQVIDLLRNAVIGALVTLWCHAEKHIAADNTLELSSQSVDALVGLEGFFASVSRQWIDELNNGRIVLPGYCEKNALITKKKRPVKRDASITPIQHADGYSRSYGARDDDLTRARDARECGDSANRLAEQVVTSGTHDEESSNSQLPTSNNPLILEGGWEGSKSKRGCGGERERGSEGGSALIFEPSTTRARLLPQDFVLTATMRNYATTRAKDCDVEAWFELFLAHHRAHGKRMLDWPAAWRTWVGNGQRFGYPKLPPSKGGNGLPLLNG